MSSAQPTPYQIVLARHQSLDKRRFRLAPSAQVLTRPNYRIQFGANAFAAGIIDVEPDNYSAVLVVLNSLKTPQTRLATKLTKAGLDDLAAHSLISDLTTYGILREVGPKPVVAVVGTTPAADLVRELLTRSGILVRSPLHQETDHYFINRLESHIPLVVMDYLNRTESLTHYVFRRPNVIPAALYDTNAMVGPIRIGGHGPCIHCALEYERAQDDHWPSVMMNYSETRADPITTTALATSVAAVATAMVGILPGAGTPPFPVQAGSVTRMDPFGLSVAHSVMDTHPLCTYCHTIISDEQLWKQLHNEEDSAAVVPS